MFHYRDSKKLEVDLVIEAGNTLSLIEAKSGETVADDFFTALRSLGQAVRSAAPELSLSLRLIYGGNTPQHRSDVTVDPWHAFAAAT